MQQANPHRFIGIEHFGGLEITPRGAFAAVGRVTGADELRLVVAAAAAVGPAGAGVAAAPGAGRGQGKQSQCAKEQPHETCMTWGRSGGPCRTMAAPEATGVAHRPRWAGWLSLRSGARSHTLPDRARLCDEVDVSLGKREGIVNATINDDYERASLVKQANAQLCDRKQVDYVVQSVEWRDHIR